MKMSEVKTMIREIVRQRLSENDDSPTHALNAFILKQLKGKAIDGWAFSINANGYISLTKYINGKEYKYGSVNWHADKNNTEKMWASIILFVRRDKKHIQIFPSIHSKDLPEDNVKKAYAIWLKSLKKYMKTSMKAIK